MMRGTGLSWTSDNTGVNSVVVSIQYMMSGMGWDGSVTILVS